MRAPSWRFTVGLPHQPPAEPSPGPRIEARGEFLGAKPERHRFGRAFVRVGVQGEQRAAAVEIELSKPSPTGT